MSTPTYHLANPLMHGPPIRALQTLLNHKGFHCTVDGVFGPATAHQCVEAKKYLKYPVSNQRPCAGKDLIRKLNDLPDHKPAVDAPKHRFVQELLWMIRNGANLHYRGVRLVNFAQKYHSLPIYQDCSGTIGLAAHWAGCPDPSGYHYHGEAYTGYILDHCRKVTQQQAQAGDLIVFGNYPGHHVVGILDVLSGGRDFDLFSHGREGGARASIKFSVERRYQPAAVHFCRFV